MRRGAAPHALAALLLILALPAAVRAQATAPAAAPAPAWVVRPVAPDATVVLAQSYVVRPGDTLSRIVARTGAGADAIAAANRLAPPYPVRAGQRLRIPGGRYHRVRRGESGIAIARAYGVDWSRVATLNHLDEPALLHEGDRLLLPDAAEVATMSMEARARAFTIDIDDLVTGAEPALATSARPARPVRSAAAAVPPTVPVAAPAGDAPGRFAWPLTGAILRPFGALASGGRNDGINIAAPLGSAVRAAADGVVAYAGELAGFGRLVLLRHAGGWLTAYGHAERLLVTRGQAVRQGQPIARAGATGSAREPQLHFEIRDGRRPVNPLDLLPRG